MPFDGSGTFTATASSFNPAVDATEIDSSDWNDLLTEIEAALTKAICKDGQSTTTAEINFAAGLKTTNTGLKVLDTNASHTLAITPGSDLTANRIFTLTTGDQAVTLNMSAGSLTAGGGQYVFPATQNASADANTLDDYEEGTWTIGVAFGGGTTGITYTTQSGVYTKTGRAVSIQGLVVLSNKGSSTGPATMTGLPFTSSSAHTALFALSYGDINLDAAGGFYSPHGHTSNATTVSLREQGDNVGQTPLTEADFANASVIYISGEYIV